MRVESGGRCSAGLVDQFIVPSFSVGEVLRDLALKGCIVTMDAVGCQKKIAAAIADNGANRLKQLLGS